MTSATLPVEWYRTSDFKAMVTRQDYSARNKNKGGVFEKPSKKMFKGVLPGEFPMP